MIDVCAKGKALVGLVKVTLGKHATPAGYTAQVEDEFNGEFLVKTTV